MTKERTTDTANTNSFMRDYSYRIVGPVMYRYVRWVIDEAMRRGIDRLYFLARDGYLLWKIAEMICIGEHINIDCRYLYCSRNALRIPTYALIGDEAYSLLLCGGYYLTPRTLLARAGILEQEADRILGELGISDGNKALREGEFDNFCRKIEKNDSYIKAVLEGSKETYPAAIAYLRQAGLFDGDYVAIVDSGWTGSIQRSLRQLLQSQNYCGRMIGFYFGMYRDPIDPSDGEFLTFYFNGSFGTERKIMFNNNVFECMLSAPHPMTLKYGVNEKGAYPIFAKNHRKSMLSLINAQIKGALEYTAEALKDGNSRPSHKVLCKDCYRILKRAMVYPSRREAELYGSFAFCDDTTEFYSLPLADGRMRRALGRYMLIPRVLRKIFRRKQSGEAELLWVYGVIAFLPRLIRPWYRINVILWEWLKVYLKR